MNYTVFWTPSAEEELADIWLNAADRAAITQASHRIDQRLRRDPGNDGESRSRGRRIMIDRPLAVIYRPHPEDRTVDVLHVWTF